MPVNEQQIPACADEAEAGWAPVRSSLRPALSGATWTLFAIAALLVILGRSDGSTTWLWSFPAAVAGIVAGAVSRTWVPTAANVVVASVLPITLFIFV